MKNNRKNRAYSKIFHRNQINSGKKHVYCAFKVSQELISSSKDESILEKIISENAANGFASAKKVFRLKWDYSRTETTRGFENDDFTRGLWTFQIKYFR